MTNEEQYFTIEGYGNFLRVGSDKIDSFVNFINSENIRNVCVNPYWGYELRELHFLDRCPQVEKIYAVGDHFDLTSLNALHNLTFLSTSSSLTPLDFSNFPHLTYCTITWGKKVMNLEACKDLAHLQIHKYKAVGNNLADLPFFSKLITLELISSSLTSLNGIEKYSSLIGFNGYYLTRLTDISAVSSLVKLRSIILENCKKIVDFDALKENKLLKKVILSGCGDIKSIRFIKNLNLLDFFTFVGSNVMDGDVTPCTGLKYVAFTNKKHYTHSLKEIRALVL